jgi:hypothetical protein
MQECKVITASYDLIALMKEESSTYETSVNLYQTLRRNNPEDKISFKAKLIHGTQFVSTVPCVL